MGAGIARRICVGAQKFVLASAVAACTAKLQTLPGQLPPGQTGSKPVEPAENRGAIGATSDKQADPSQNQQNPVPPIPANVPQPQPNGPSVPITFESRGLEYDALTKNGITVMFAALPPHIKEFNVAQVTVTNGSLVSWTTKPQDFEFIRQDGGVLPTVSADEVVENLMEKADRNDVIKLQLLYENTIYALSNFRSTNGYEQRREAAMAQFVNKGFKAAAAASAIAFVQTKLKPGDSTDGAIFFENRTKAKGLGTGRLIAHVCGETFIFETYGEYKKR